MIELRKVDVFGVLSPAEDSTMDTWAAAFNVEVARNPGRRVLLGYSMGGRLALHALIDRPSLWDGAVIVSAHPGLGDAERPARIEADAIWAHRFETEPWSRLIAEWERLPVFCGRSLPFERREGDFCRRELAAALRAWSTGRQSDLRRSTGNLQMPILWSAGEQDLRYATLVRTLRDECQRQSEAGWREYWIAHDSGHRVPWELPEAFRDRVCRFLGQFA